MVADASSGVGERATVDERLAQASVGISCQGRPERDHLTRRLRSSTMAEDRRLGGGNAEAYARARAGLSEPDTASVRVDDRAGDREA